jgi:hypothetical protein
MLFQVMLDLRVEEDVRHYQERRKDLSDIAFEPS